MRIFYQCLGCNFDELKKMGILVRNYSIIPIAQASVQHEFFSKIMHDTIEVRSNPNSLSKDMQDDILDIKNHFFLC